MLKKRILSLIIGFWFAMLVVIYTNIAVVSIVVGVLMTIAVYEFDKAFKNKGINTFIDITFLSIVSMGAINILNYLGYITMPMEQLYLYIFYPITLLTLFIAFVIKHKQHDIIDVGATMIQLFYCVFLFGFLVNIYGLENGKFLIWYVFIASWVPDICAFCVGKTIGKHKFTELSPNKTIEGCIGGVIGGTIAVGAYTYIINMLFSMSIPIIPMLILGAICAIVSEMGDLFASSIKRYTGVKDFGNILPGHGGIMDRFDSTVFVIPLIYIIFTIFI